MSNSERVNGIIEKQYARVVTGSAFSGFAPTRGAAIER
jgi:hypothetical protein